VSAPRKTAWIRFAALGALGLISCGHAATNSPSDSSGTASAADLQETSTLGPSRKAPPPSQTGGFDGAQAYDYVAKLVNFGPRPPASDAIHRTQDYIHAQLQGFGCTVDEDAFHSQTPLGDVSMKNIIAKVPGSGQGIILLLTHYDTLRIDNFVGAEDGGSSTGLMLEMARLLCAGKHQPNAVWIAFLDGEEAQVAWTDTDSVYGSRELAARMAVSGDLKRVRAVILADMIGQNNLAIARESNSTKWLTNLVWDTASRLGYKAVFISRETAIEDDHLPFIHRGVPSVDLIDFEGYQTPLYWHTPQDTLDKISPRSLAVVGHVILESVTQLQNKFH
jgi:glutaminyl-peptide cyclotransferase